MNVSGEENDLTAHVVSADTRPLPHTDAHSLEEQSLPFEVAASTGLTDGGVIEDEDGAVFERQLDGRRKNRRKLSVPARILRFFARVLTLLVGSAIGVGALVVAMSLVGAQLPKFGKTVSYNVEKVGELTPLNQRSVMLDKDGRRLSVLRSEQNRLEVALDRVPKHLIDTVLAVEDANFYRHKGVNLRSTARALVANVEAGGVSQGGSTITQQLVKLTLLTSKQDVNRKIREARFAMQIEKKYTKDEILGRYLNTVYFGEGAYGVQAAAERYFNKDISALTIADSAFLAGMIRNPTGYDPIRFRDRSRQRRAVVLERMAKVGLIDEKEKEDIRVSPMPRPADRLSSKETYFIEEVKQQLLDDRRLGETRADRFNAVFNGGLTIRTTFDPRAQEIAERAVRETLPSRQSDFTAALVAVDVNSGAVRAMVGGRGFETDKYNLVTQGKRQPGSSWKPFVLIAAMEQGISPRSLIDGNEPCAIPNPTGKPKVFRPRNAEPPQRGALTILDQLIISSNCAFARLAYVTGYRNIADVAKRLGITTRIDEVPAMALGVEEVHPMEMAGAYATIAAGGRQRKAYVIEEVIDRKNKTIFRGRSTDRQLIDQEIARAVLAGMQGVVERGTGVAAQLENRDVAGKTGTTNNFEDAWFVGFTPQLTTAVWMGAPDRKLSMRNVGGREVFGGTYPAEIFHRFMGDYLATEPIAYFPDLNENTLDIGECVSLVVQKPRVQRSRSSGRGSSGQSASADAASGDEEKPLSISERKRVRCGNFEPAQSARPVGDPQLGDDSSTSKKKRKKSRASNGGDASTVDKQQKKRVAKKKRREKAPEVAPDPQPPTRREVPVVEQQPAPVEPAPAPPPPAPEPPPPPPAPEPPPPAPPEPAPAPVA